MKNPNDIPKSSDQIAHEFDSLTAMPTFTQMEELRQKTADIKPPVAPEQPQVPYEVDENAWLEWGDKQKEYEEKLAKYNAAKKGVTEVDTTGHETPKEIRDAYINQVSEIEEPKDKYLALATLKRLTDDKILDNDEFVTEAVNGMNTLSEFFNRDDKNMGLGEYIDKKRQENIENHREDLNSRYDFNYRFRRYLENEEQEAKTKAYSESSNTLDTTEHETPEERRDIYFAQVSKIKEPKDKYFALATLGRITDDEVLNDSKISAEAVNSMDILSEFFNRDDKNMGLREYIDNKKQENIENHREDLNSHYDLSENLSRFFEMEEQNAKIKAYGENLNPAIDSLNDKYTSYGYYRFGLRFYHKDPKTPEDKLNDSLIVSMAHEYVDKAISLSKTEAIIERKEEELKYNNNPEDKAALEALKDKYYKEALSRNYEGDLSTLLSCNNGKDFDEQIENGYYPNRIKQQIRKTKAEFYRLKDNYKYFEEDVATGQEILDKAS